MALNYFKYIIKISGKEISQSRYNCITNVSVFQTVDGSSTANIKVADPDFIFINDNIFREEATISIQIIWYGNPTKITFSGYISAIKASFPSNGLPTLDITCMDETHRMNRKKKKKTYKKTSSRNVVKKIAKSYGYKVRFTKGWKSVKQESISQSNQTDIDFLTNLAGSESYPFAVFLRGNTLYYVRKGLPSSKVTAVLNYRLYPYEILDYSPSIVMEEVKKIEKVKKKKKSKKGKSSSKSSSKKSSNRGVSRSSGNSSSSRSGSSSRKSTKGSTTKTKTYNPRTKSWS